jgi:hypothetical protein
MAPEPWRKIVHKIPHARRSLVAGGAVASLIALSLITGGRETSASSGNLASAQFSPGNFGGLPAVTTTTAAPAPGTSPEGNATTTTAKPTTTAAPPAECGADKHAGFGCPLMTDNFDGTQLDDGIQGWSVYDYPDANFPRVASNFSVGGGTAQLRGTYDKGTGTILGSGMASHVSQKYGRWEMRVKVDAGRGYSAAGLLWPTSERWPTDGEVDLFEIPHAARQDIFQTVHNGVRNNTGENKIFMDATQWHTYAIEWSPTKLVYYVDGAVKWTVTKSALVPSTGNLNLTLQLDPGTAKECGTWFECPNASTPAVTTMSVDYVKIWKYNG